MTEIASSRVLVTGGTGFIGSHLVRRLVRLGAPVHLLVRPRSPCSRLRDVLPDVTLHRGDLTDPRALEGCLAAARPEVVFHLAGATDVRHLNGDPGQLDRAINTNLLGSLNLLQAARRTQPGVRCFVRTGGVEEYGNGELPFQEGQREQPVSPYSASQVATTHFLQMLQRTLGLPLVTLRPTLTYGPGQSTDFFIPSLIAHCLEGREFAMTSGSQTRDFVYVDDVVEAYLRAATAPRARGEVINVGSGREYRIRDVARAVVELSGARIRLKYEALPPRPAGIERMCSDVGKARRILGWSPVTPLEEGLRRTFAWYRDQRGSEVVPSP